jgi:hypothetical protein
MRKSSHEIADLQQTAQIISGFRSSFLPRRPKAGQSDGNPGEFNDCSDLLNNIKVSDSPDYLFQNKPFIFSIQPIYR